MTEFQKIAIVLEGFPLQETSDARRGEEVFEEISFMIRCGGAPPGAAGFIAPGDEKVINIHFKIVWFQSALFPFFF